MYGLRRKIVWAAAVSAKLPLNAFLDSGLFVADH